MKRKDEETIEFFISLIGFMSAVFISWQVNLYFEAKAHPTFCESEFFEHKGNFFFGKKWACSQLKRKVKK
jgi:hypothetical protein